MSFWMYTKPFLKVDSSEREQRLQELVEAVTSLERQRILAEYGLYLTQLVGTTSRTCKRLQEEEVKLRGSIRLRRDDHEWWLHSRGARKRRKEEIRGQLIDLVHQQQTLRDQLTETKRLIKDITTTTPTQKEVNNSSRSEGSKVTTDIDWTHLHAMLMHENERRPYISMPKYPVITTWTGLIQDAAPRLHLTPCDLLKTIELHAGFVGEHTLEPLSRYTEKTRHHSIGRLIETRNWDDLGKRLEFDRHQSSTKLIFTDESLHDGVLKTITFIAAKYFEDPEGLHCHLKNRINKATHTADLKLKFEDLWQIEGEGAKGRSDVEDFRHFLQIHLGKPGSRHMKLGSMPRVVLPPKDIDILVRWYDVRLRQENGSLRS